MAGAGDALAAWTFSRCGPVLGRPWTPCKFSGWRTYRSSEYLKPGGTSHQHELPVPCAWMGWPTPTPPSDATHTPSCQPHRQIAARIHCRYATTLQMAQKRADAESSRPQLRVPRNRIRHRPTQCRLSSTGSPWHFPGHQVCHPIQDSRCLCGVLSLRGTQAGCSLLQIRPLIPAQRRALASSS